MILILLLIHSLWFGVLYLKNAKHFKKKISENLMLIAWDPKRRRKCCFAEDIKKI